MTPGAYQPVGTARATERGPGRVRLAAGEALAEVTALAPDCFRVGLFGGGRPSTRRTRSPRRAGAAEPTEGARRARDGRGARDVALDPLRISFRARRRHELAADDPELRHGLRAAAGDRLGGQLARRRRRCCTSAAARASASSAAASARAAWRRPARARSSGTSTRRRATPRRSTTSTRRSRSCSRSQDGRAHGLFVDYPGRSVVDLAKADPDRVTLVGARAATSSTTSSAGRRRRASSSASPR